MAPMRRRASRRVVKSTFQECFEYDIPGFRGVEGKRPVVAATRTRVTPNTKTKPKPKPKPKPKEEAFSKSVEKNERVKKPTTNIDKGKSKTVEPKESSLENICSERQRKLKSSLRSIRKVKNTFVGSDYKRFKAPLKNNSMKIKTIKERELPTKANSESSASEQNFGSKTWQPVVSLEKICVSSTKSSETPEQTKRITLRKQYPKQSSLKTHALATRLKNVLKDPMAETEDTESNLVDKTTSNTALKEVLKETCAIMTRTALSRKALPEEEGDNSLKVGKKKISDTKFQDNKSSIKPPECDSALEDWPESSSELSEEKPLYKDLEDIASASAVTDWASPHVAFILHWHNQFTGFVHDLKRSMDTHKIDLVKRNSKMAALKKQTDCLNDTDCHKILGNILLDYDENDPKNPATAIVNSILEYPNSQC